MFRRYVLYFQYRVFIRYSHLKVRTWKMNLYTLLQVFLIAILFGLKVSPAGLLYPLAIVLLVPIRKFIGRYVFSHVEMEAVSII